MAVLSNDGIRAGASGAGESEHQIERSLRFNSNEESRLYRTCGSQGTDPKAWTLSFWAKKCGESNYGIFGASSQQWEDDVGGAFQLRQVSNAWYINWCESAGSMKVWSASGKRYWRDENAWAHIVLVFESSKSSAASRLKLYFNNERITEWASQDTMTENWESSVHSNGHHMMLGARCDDDGSVVDPLDAYMADVYFIDGQGLAPSNFAEINETTGQWSPKAYEGTYGNQGCHLLFDNISSNANLGLDSSGNGLTWTTSGLQAATTQTGTSYSVGNNFGSQLYDGTTSNNATQLTSTTYRTFTNADIVVGSSIKFYTNDETGQYNIIKDNNGNEYYTNSSVDGFNWRVLYNGTSQSGTNFTGTLAGPVQLKTSGGGSYIRAIELDGTILVDTNTTYTDSSVDSPTSYGAADDTGVGAQVRGNYATFQPTASVFNGANTDTTYRKITNGNTTVEGMSSSNSGIAASNWNQNSGKWYIEFTYVNDPDDGYAICGMFNTGYTSHHDSSPADGDGSAGSVNVDISTNTSVFGSTLTTGDVMGMAVDCDNKACYFSKNGTWVGTPTSGSSKTGASGTWTDDKLKCLGVVDIYKANNIVNVNWGQRPYKYTAPTGFKACCTTNLADVSITDSSTGFDVIGYNGAGSAPADVTGFNFAPDMVWIKKYDSVGSGYHHHIYDIARGAGNAAYADASAAEYQPTQDLLAFNSDGYEVGTFIETGYTAARSYVAWAWDAGTAAVTASTSGSITPSEQWVNNTTGFSITEFTGTGAAATVGHGLSVKPSMIWVKCRATTNPFLVWHEGFADPIDGYLQLSQADAEGNYTNYWGSGGITNSVFGLDQFSGNNASGEASVAYAWAEVPGFSKFGKYTGNGLEAGGPYIYCGFKPHFVIIKRIGSGASTNWEMTDDIINPYNQDSQQVLSANTDANASGLIMCDFVANGFKVRGSTSSVNTSSKDYIYAAWAEHPFKHARAH